MASALESNILTDRHHFEPISWDMPMHGKRSSLSRDTFAPGAGGRSLPFEAIVGTSSTPAWHSPAAFSSCAPVADLALIGDAAQLNSLGSLWKAWLGCLGDASHRMVWGIRLDGHGEWSWYIPLNHMCDSAVIAWPVRLREMSGHPETMWAEIKTDIKEPSLLSVFTLAVGNLKAASFVWKSPIAQRVAYPRSHLRPGIRCVLTEEPKDIRQVAAKQAFWSLTKPTLHSLADYWQIHVPEGADLFGTLYAMVQNCLGVSDEEAIRVVSQRLASQEQKLTFSDEMADIDEVMEVFDRPDRAAIQQEQKKVAELGKERESFRASYRKKAECVRKAAAKAAPKKRTRNKAGVASSASSAQPVRVPDIFTIAQADAATFLPPGASVWRGVQRRNWNGHMPPFPRTSSSWMRAGGEKAALRQVLRTVWGQHCDLQGMSTGDCPVIGLFPE